jgi:hypothetical protein
MTHAVQMKRKVYSQANRKSYGDLDGGLWAMAEERRRDQRGCRGYEDPNRSFG